MTQNYSLKLCTTQQLSAKILFLDRSGHVFDMKFVVCLFTCPQTFHSWDVISKTLLPWSWCFALESPDCSLLEPWGCLLVCGGWGIHGVHFLIRNTQLILNICTN